MKMKMGMMAAAVAAVVTSCAPTKSAVEPISGKWRIVSACGVSTAEGEEPAFIAFGDSGKVYGNSSINRFFGSYSQDGASLSIGEGLGMTMRMGAHPEIEQAVQKGLSQVASFAIDGDSALLKDKNGENVLVLVRENETIEGEWLIVQAYNLATAEASDTAFVSFSADGKMAGCTGANRFFGTFTVSGSGVTISGIGTTRMAAGPYQATEDAGLKALGEARSFSVDGARACLTDSTGTAVLWLDKK